MTNPCPSSRHLSSSTLPPSSLSSSSPWLSCELGGCDGPARKSPPLALPLFSTTISFSQPFSLLRSVASCSNSSTRPDRSDTVRSRLCALTFFLTRKRATEKRRLSCYSLSAMMAYPRLQYFVCASPQTSLRDRPVDFPESELV
jgi:hypothetical protein